MVLGILIEGDTRCDSGSIKSNASSHSSPNAHRRGSFDSTADLVKKIDRFIRTHNANSRPFVWTATADSIL
jgi:putative transposase